MNKKISTFIMLKPDALQRNMEATLLQELTALPLQIEEKKIVTVFKETILKHYEEVIARVPIQNFQELVIQEFVGKEVMILKVSSEDKDIIEKIHELVGTTDPSKANVHTLRYKYGSDSYEFANQEGRMVRNLIHASDSLSNAHTEIQLWFPNEEHCQ